MSPALHHKDVVAGFDRAFADEGAAPTGTSTWAGLAAPGPGQWHQCTRRALRLPGPPLTRDQGRAPRPRGSGGTVEPCVVDPEGVAEEGALQSET